MATELIENELYRFLSTSEPEAICLSGHWGVGKTFAWNHYLKQAKEKNRIALSRYSYVSLFGINSLDELKYTIFENSIRTSEIDCPPTLESLEKNFASTIASYGRQAARKIAGVTQQTPLLRNYLGGLAPVWFASVHANIICIDDLERRGKNLSIRDVMGLLSNLKEIKRCKVCLILNDEELEDSAADFKKYREKVVDATLKFEPSPRDCVRIALTEDSEDNKLLSENCITLGISNIRVIKKIERLVRLVQPLVSGFDRQVLKQAVHSLTLFGWSEYEPGRAPSMDYLRDRNAFDPAPADKTKYTPENESAWSALLRAYGFDTIDEFDLALLGGLENGFFDPTLVKNGGAELDKKIKAGSLDTSFHKAWDMFHDSFDKNQDQVLDAMYQSFKNGVQYITPLNMSSTIALFKELGRRSQAIEMLDYYIQARGEEKELFDLEHNPFGRVSDADVIEAFGKKYATFKREIDPKSILLSISDSQSWTADGISSLAALSVDQYRNLFKETSGMELRKLIRASLMFSTMADAGSNYMQVSTRAMEALKQIGEESEINAQRVRKYGITIKPDHPK